MMFQLSRRSFRHLGLAASCFYRRQFSSCRNIAVVRLQSQVFFIPLGESRLQWCSHNAASYSTTGSAATLNIAPSGDSTQPHLSVDSQGRALTVTWTDGTTSSFHSVWLRHNCHCVDCRQDHSGQRLIDPAAVPHDITIDHVSVTGDDLAIQWGGEKQHAGRVPLNYLGHHGYESHDLDRRAEDIKLDKPVKVLPEVTYTDLISSDTHVLRWLRQINEAGISLLTGVPTEETLLPKIAERIGPVEDLIYGETFDVVSTQKPINVAYSSVELDFHMDLVYYESPPGLQFLHCLRFDDCVEGGDSRFLDVFQVAEDFRGSHPEHFSTLVRVPATFQKIHYDRDYPVHMKYQRPHIVLNPNQQIIGVNWAPPFEGPLAVKQDDVLPYYAAYEAFAKAIKSSPHVVEYHLKPGDLVAFNNRRILHARKSFQLNGGGRHLKGCYVNIDHFKSRVNIMSHLHGNAQPAKRVGNQDWF